MIKLLFKFALASLLLAVGIGCSEEKKEYRWRVTHIAVTQTEHDRIDAHVRDILSHVPNNVQGHDQDLDDYARVVYAGALETLTPPRLMEEIYVGDGIWRDTGRWKDSENSNKLAPLPSIPEIKP